MVDFAVSTATRNGLDPRKRVNYPLGMVLGADEFEQEQYYLRSRDHAGVRALHGYGTVSGLEVTWNETAGQVEVAPGVAVDPAGRLVCVPVRQCADLVEWLTSRRDALGASGSPPGGTSLYVVLCHRECETDTVPLPSETCRSDEESAAASRILESFELRLLLSPPDTGGEVAGGALTAAVERLLALLESTPGDPAADADAVRRELTTWATTARPEVPVDACLGAPPDDCGDRAGATSTAVLLARIDLDLVEDPSGRIVPRTGPEVDARDRPVLLSTRFLQEWLTGIMLNPELFGPPPIEDHNALDNLDTGDAHPQYVPADGSRPLTGDLDAGGNRLGGLGASSAPGDAMRADEIVGGDLERGPDGLRLARLQGGDVSAAETDAPRDGDLLGFDGTTWRPVRLPPAKTGAVLPLVTVEPVGGVEGAAVFLLWFHLEVPGNTVVIDDLTYGEQFSIRSERCVDGVPGLQTVRRDLVASERVECNVFRVDVRSSAQLLRFVFATEAISLGGETLAERTEAHGISWVGQDGAGTITEFVLNPMPAGRGGEPGLIRAIEEPVRLGQIDRLTGRFALVDRGR